MTDGDRSPNPLTRLLVSLGLILLVANLVQDYRLGRLPGLGRTQGPGPTARPGRAEARLAPGGGLARPGGLVAASQPASNSLAAGDTPAHQQHRLGSPLPVRRPPRRARPVDGAVRQAHRPERSRRAAARSKSPQPEALTISAPASLTLKPLGYIDQADGKKLAVLPEGEHVALVSEGEVFSSRYRVLGVSAQAVTLQDEQVQMAGMAGPPPATPDPRSSGEENLTAVAGVPGGPTLPRPEEAVDPPLPLNPLPSRGWGIVEAPGTLASDHLELSAKGEDLLPSFDPAATPAQALPGPPTATGQAFPGVPVNDRDPPAQEGTRSRDAPGEFSAPATEAAGRAPPPAAYPDVGRGPPGPDPPVSRSGEGPVQVLGFVEPATGRMEAVVKFEGEVHLVKEGDALGEGCVVSRVLPGIMVVSPALVTPAAPWSPDAGVLCPGRALVLTCCGYSSTSP